MRNSIRLSYKTSLLTESQAFLKSTNSRCTAFYTEGGMALTVKQLAKVWKVRGSNPGGGEIFRTYPDRLRGPPNLLYNGYRAFPGGKGGRGVMLTTRPHLVPRCTERSRAIPLPSLRDFEAYERVKLYLTSNPQRAGSNLSQ